MRRMVWIRFTNRKSSFSIIKKWEKNFHFPTSSLPVCVANSAEFRVCASDVSSSESEVKGGTSVELRSKVGCPAFR